MTTESCCSRGTSTSMGMGTIGGGGSGGITMGGKGAAGGAGGGGGGADHHENSNHNNHHNNSSDCAAASDCESDCSQFESSSVSNPQQDEDQILKRAEALTMEEVIQRRVRRLRKLMKVYRSQYWGLVEEMRTKYRRFYLRHGKSGWRDDVDAERDALVGDGGGSGGGSGDGMREPERRLGIAENVHCAAQGCMEKPLSLSVFCFAHILLEPRQRLYKPCSHVIRTGQTCGKPVLRAVVPPLCGFHFHRAQRQATKSLNKVLPGGIKFNPKIHLIVSQYVRVIQSKRRNHRGTALAAKAAKLEAAGKMETNGKEVVLSQQVGGVRRSSSSAGGGATRATAAANANHEERKPLANGQAKVKDVLQPP